MPLLACFLAGIIYAKVRRFKNILSLRLGVPAGHQTADRSRHFLSNLSLYLYFSYEFEHANMFLNTRRNFVDTACRHDIEKKHSWQEPLFCCSKHRPRGGRLPNSWHTTWAGTHNRLCRTLLFILYWHNRLIKGGRPFLKSERTRQRTRRLIKHCQTNTLLILFLGSSHS